MQPKCKLTVSLSNVGLRSLFPFRLVLCFKGFGLGVYGLGVGFRPLTASNCLSRLNLQIVNISTCSASFRASLRNAAAQISPAAAKTYRSFVRSHETSQEGTDRLLQRCNIETTEPVPPDVHRSSVATDAWAFPDNVQTQHLNSTSLSQP